MIQLHRVSDGIAGERIAIPIRDILQIHEGKGGITIVTTSLGKVAVAESFADVMTEFDRACENERAD